MKTTLYSCFIVLALSSTAPAQNLFVSDGGSGNIYQFTPDGKTQTTFATGLNSPEGLAFDSAGNLFVADSGSGNVYKYTPSGQTRTVFAGGFSEPFALAFNQAGNLFVSDIGTGTIYGFTNNAGTLSSNAVPFASGLSLPLSLAFDSAGNLFVGENNGIIYKFTTNGTSNTFATVSPGPNGLAFNTAGNLFVADSVNNGNGQGYIYEFTPDGTMLTNFASGLSEPNGLVFDSAGNLFVANPGLEGDTHIIIEIITNGVQTTFASGLNNPQYIAIAPNLTLSVSIKMFAGIILNNGQIGSNYLIQATSSLASSNWITLTNLTLPSQPYIYIDYSSYTNRQQFYRVTPQ